MRIGIFDSGIGGITVLSELRKKLGAVDYVYLGDTAHLPYGEKSPSQIQMLSARCALTLKDRNIDALVVACNTASSLALDAIQEVMGKTPVFGVVSPGIEAALQALETIPAPTETESRGPILVLATRATVQSQAYGKMLRKLVRTSELGSPAVSIFEQACPLLVPMIEEGWIDHPILHQTIHTYVRSYLEQSKSGVALLGCTHYPWIHSAFEKALPGWKVVNSASAVAASLRKSQLFGTGSDPLVGEYSSSDKRPTGHVEWIFTDHDSLPSFARSWISSLAVQAV